MSSVKPFELMLGKIIGSAGVGMTQLLIWAVLNTFIFFGIQLFLGIDTSSAAVTSQAGMGAATEMQDSLPALIEEIMSQNWCYILVVGLIFFLRGYICLDVCCSG